MSSRFDHTNVYTRTKAEAAQLPADILGLPERRTGEGGTDP